VRKVFISYARQNRPEVDQLAGHLGMLGCDVWIDKSLRGGQDWWQEILRQIADCDTFIAIISHEALSSTACRLEHEWAKKLGKPMLPVAVQPVPKALPSRFVRLHIIDYSTPADRELVALTLGGELATLPASPPLPDPLPDPPDAPLSYLTDLIDQVMQPQPLDHAQQRHILNQLESALYSTDPQVRMGGHDILKLLSDRDDVYRDIDRAINRLKADAPTSAPSAEVTKKEPLQAEAPIGSGSTPVEAAVKQDNSQAPSASAVEPTDQPVSGTPAPVGRADAKTTQTARSPAEPQSTRGRKGVTSGSSKTRVATQYSDSGTESMLRFFTRGVDLAYVGMVPFTLGLAYGLPLRVAAVAQSAGPTHSVVLKKRIHASDAPLRIATVFGSSGHFVGWHWARTAGLDVMFIDLRPLDQVRAFHQGYIHGIASWEPHVSACVGEESDVAFSADDLPFTLLDLIVTSEVLAPRALEIDRIVEMHRRISETLADAPREIDVEYLEEYLGTRWNEKTARRLLHAAFKSAASENLEQHLKDMEVGVAVIREFAAATGFGTGAPSPPGDDPKILGISHWERLTYPKQAGDIIVGYSDDLMCAPLVLGRLAHPAAEDSGVTFVQQPRRNIERIAALSVPLRKSVAQARELIPKDPALATIKMARLVELNLCDLADHFMGAHSPREFSAVIAGLEERGILPPLVASSAHWIRSVSNVVAHQDDLSEATASAALTHLLEVLEWLQESQATSEKRCPHCSGLLESEWTVCPHCEWRFERNCEQCGLAIDASWKACPGCGSSTTKQERSGKG
jgi:ABC-type nitrate/sulfonate/bicarbonate transport system substrate-binding protein/RNA polymerase subunit RPABC4/transcription elongation factor Spt4